MAGCEEYLVCSVSLTYFFGRSFRCKLTEISLINIDSVWTKDPDYECLMLPSVLREGHAKVLADLGFTYDAERGMFYHHGTEFGRRKADPEEVSLEKFTNYLDVSVFF